MSTFFPEGKIKDLQRTDQRGLFFFKGDFFGFFLFIYDLEHCFIYPPQIQLCRRMLGSNPGQSRLRSWCSRITRLGNDFGTTDSIWEATYDYAQHSPIHAYITAIQYCKKHTTLTPLFRSMKALRPTAAQLSSVSLADFLASKDLADFFCLNTLLDFLAVGFAYSPPLVCCCCRRMPNSCLVTGWASLCVEDASSASGSSWREWSAAPLPAPWACRWAMFKVFFSFNVRYSTLLHLPPLRLHSVGGCRDRTQDCCHILALAARRSNHLARSHPQLG